MKKGFSFALVLLILIGCAPKSLPELPESVPPFIGENCILPSLDALHDVYDVDWKGMVLTATAPLGEQESKGLAQKVQNEYFFVDSAENIYCGDFNFNKGQKVGERRSVPLDRSKVYILLPVDTLIGLVSYLVEHLWTSATNALLEYLGDFGSV